MAAARADFFRESRCRFGGVGKRQEAHALAVFADFVAGMFAAVAVVSLGTARVDRSEAGIFLYSGTGMASRRGANAIAVFAAFADDVAGDMAAHDMDEFIAVFAAISM